MDTLTIILIAVGVIALLALIFFLVLSPKRRAERRLVEQRDQAAGHHREIASDRHQHATLAEQKAEEARLEASRAEQQAQMAREEANVHEGRADLHEQGLADHELEDGPDGDDRTSADDRNSNANGRFRTDEVQQSPSGPTPPPRG